MYTSGKKKKKIVYFFGRFKKKKERKKEEFNQFKSNQSNVYRMTQKFWSKLLRKQITSVRVIFI